MREKNGQVIPMDSMAAGNEAAMYRRSAVFPIYTQRQAVGDTFGCKPDCSHVMYFLCAGGVVFLYFQWCSLSAKYKKIIQGA